MAWVGRQPRICLKHLHDLRAYPGMSRETFSVTLIRVLRPDRGVTVAAVRCEGCGEKKVELRIFGLQETVRARLRFFVPAVVAAVATLVLIYYLIRGLTGVEGGMDPVLLLCVCLASGLTIGGFVGFYNEDGVRFVRRSRDHSLVR